MSTLGTCSSVCIAYLSPSQCGFGRTCVSIRLLCNRKADYQWTTNKHQMVSAKLKNWPTQTWFCKCSILSRSASAMPRSLNAMPNEITILTFLFIQKLYFFFFKPEIKHESNFTRIYRNDAVFLG